MAANLREAPGVWGRTSERLTRALDLLVLFDKESQFHLATACMDILNFSLRESLDAVELSKDSELPYTINFWRSIRDASEKGPNTYNIIGDVVFDKECRKAMVSHWISNRPKFEKKDFNKKAKAQDILFKVVDLFSATHVVRNNLIDSLEPLRQDLEKFALSTEGLVTSVVEQSQKLPKCFDEYKNVQTSPKESAHFEKVKSVLRETKRLLYVIQMNHNAYFLSETGVFAAPYERWVDQLFDLMHEYRCNSEKYHVLTTHLLSYQYLKNYLKGYNVFEEVPWLRPEGTYTEVKYSAYFQHRYIKWKISQGFAIVYRKALSSDKFESELDRVGPYGLSVLLMQVFGLIVDEITPFVFAFTVLRDFWASNDKLKHLQGLNTSQKEVIDLYNRISLMFYRRPTVNPVMEGAEPSILLKETNEPERLDRRVFEELLKDASLADCSKFKIWLSKNAFKDYEDKFKELALKNRTQTEGPLFRRDDMFESNRVEDAEKGLKSVLEFYLNCKD